MNIMDNNIYSHESMRAHIFDYIKHANRITTEKATLEFALESIPEAEEGDMDIITNRINATDRDMNVIQDIMFSTPMVFTADQAWALAEILIAHVRDDSIRQRAVFRRNGLAVMMAVHPRLGADSPLAAVETLTLRAIIELSILS